MMNKYLMDRPIFWKWAGWNFRPMYEWASSILRLLLGGPGRGGSDYFGHGDAGQELAGPPMPVALRPPVRLLRLLPPRLPPQPPALAGAAADSGDRQWPGGRRRGPRRGCEGQWCDFVLVVQYLQARVRFAPGPALPLQIWSAQVQCEAFFYFFFPLLVVACYWFFMVNCVFQWWKMIFGYDLF